MLHSPTTMHPNPYASPAAEEQPIRAELAVPDPPGSSAVYKTIGGVALTIGAVFGLETVVKDPVGRTALLGAATAGLMYSASLTKRDESLS